MNEAGAALPWVRISLIFGAVAAALAAATLYGSAPEAGKGADDCPVASFAAAQRLAPLAQGDVAAVAVARTPRPALALTFQDAGGKALTLADFRGKNLLVNVKSLARYADPKGDAFEALRVAGKALGLPTSLLVDRNGCELAVIGGPANWDSDDAQKLIAALNGT
jgi:hypothetical protein